MVEYEVSHFGISQILSQDSVDPAALFSRNGYFSCLRVFANLVCGVITLFRCEIVGKQIQSQCFEASCFPWRFSMLCSSAGRFSMLCSNAGRAMFS